MPVEMTIKCHGCGVTSSFSYLFEAPVFACSSCGETFVVPPPGTTGGHIGFRTIEEWQAVYLNHAIVSVQNWLVLAGLDNGVSKRIAYEALKMVQPSRSIKIDGVQYKAIAKGRDIRITMPS